MIDMTESRLNTVARLHAFLEGTLEVRFRALNDARVGRSGLALASS